MARVRGGRYESQSPFFLKRNGQRVCDFCLSSLTDRKRVYGHPRWYWLCEACQIGFPAQSGRTLTARIRARRKPFLAVTLRSFILVLSWLLLAQPVDAAITFSRSTGVDTGIEYTKQIAFGTAPSQGDLVAVVVCGQQGIDFQVQSVSDNQGNTYTRAERIKPSSASFTELAVYYTANIPTPSGTFSITVTPVETSGNNLSVIGLAYGGLEGSGVVDVTDTGETTSPTDASVGPSSPTTVSDALILAAACMQASDDDVVITGPAGYTERADQPNGFFPALHVADKIVSSTGTQSAAWSHDDANTGAVLVVFKGASSAPPPVTGTADATLSWVEPTVNQDGSPLTDLSNTQGFYKRPNSSAWVSCITKNAPVVTGGASQTGTCTVPVPAGTEENVSFVVRPYDQRGNEGTWSPIIIKPLTGS